MNKKKQKGSFVTVNFNSQIHPGTSALYSGWFPMNYPESLGVAIIEGGNYCNRRFGSFCWKPTQWSGLNVTNETEVSEVNPSTPAIILDKNTLMRSIINKKDRKLLNKYKSIFKPEEIKFLKDKLLKNKKAPE